MFRYVRVFFMAEKHAVNLSNLHNRVAYIDSTLRQALTLVTDLEALLDEDRRADGSLAAELFNLDRVLTRLDQCMHKVRSGPLADPESAADTRGDETGAAPVAGERELLLQALDAQEDRIRQLEDRLRALQNDDDQLIDRTGARQSQRTPPEVITNESLADDPYANRMIVTIQEGGNLKLPLSSNITTIGREPANDIQIRSRFVSRFHARILSDQDGAVIEDLDSRNGISVNAEKVRRRQLRSGDFIKIGRIQLQYIDIMEGTFGGGA